MSSVAGLLVPNNFNIASSGGDIAEGLYSNNNLNVVNTTASPNPVAGQVLQATGPNAATWQTPVESVTPTNSVALTNKTLDNASNNVTADKLFIDGKSSTIEISAGAPPEAGKVLTALSPNTANWQYPQPENGLSGGFSGVFGGAGPTVIETLSVGTRLGTFLVDMDVVASSNTGGSGIIWKIKGTFKRTYVGGNITAIAAPVITLIGSDAPMSGEPNPTLTASGADQIVLTKTGVPLDNTIWGGNWTVTTSGVFSP